MPKLRRQSYDMLWCALVAMTCYDVLRRAMTCNVGECRAVSFFTFCRQCKDSLNSSLTAGQSLDIFSFRPLRGLVVFTFGFVALHQLLLKVCDLLQRWTFSLEHVGTYVINCDKI